MEGEKIQGYIDGVALTNLANLLSPKDILLQYGSGEISLKKLQKYHLLVSQLARAPSTNWVQTLQSYLEAEGSAALAVYLKNDADAEKMSKALKPLIHADFQFSKVSPYVYDLRKDGKKIRVITESGNELERDSIGWPREDLRIHSAYISWTPFAYSEESNVVDIGDSYRNDWIESFANRDEKRTEVVLTRDFHLYPYPETGTRDPDSYVCAIIARLLDMPMIGKNSLSMKSSDEIFSAFPYQRDDIVGLLVSRNLLILAGFPLSDRCVQKNAKFFEEWFRYFAFGKVLPKEEVSDETEKVEPTQARQETASVQFSHAKELQPPWK